MVKAGNVRISITISKTLYDMIEDVRKTMVRDGHIISKSELIETILEIGIITADTKTKVR